MIGEINPAELGPRKLDLTPPKSVEVEGAGKYVFSIEPMPAIWTLGLRVIGTPENPEWGKVELPMNLAAQKYGEVGDPKLSQGLMDGTVLPTILHVEPMDIRGDGRFPDFETLSAHVGSWLPEFIRRNGFSSVDARGIPGSIGAMVLKAAGFQEKDRFTPEERKLLGLTGDERTEFTLSV